jgi:hypothetical protein
MDIEAFKLFGAVAFVVPLIFFVGFGKALVTPPHARIMAVILASAFAVGVWGLLAGGFAPLLTMTFLVPAYQYLVFRALYAIFVRQFRRAPQTAAFNFASGILPDRVFNLAFLIISFFIPLFSVAYLLRA